MTAAWRVLAAAELRQHRGRFRALGATLALATAGLLLVLGLLNGLEQAVGAELSATVAGDARIASTSTDFAAGALLELQAPLFALEGFGALHPRIETPVLFAAGGGVENWSAGLLVGIDVARDRGIVSRLVEGTLAADEYVSLGNQSLVPLVVGESLAERLRIRPGSVLNVTAGRIEDTPSGPRPIVQRAVVTGLYDTGIPVIDLYAIYAPVERARALLALHPAEPVATVIVALTDRPDAVVARAREMGLAALTLPEFETDYLGTVFSGLRAVAAGVAAIAVLSILAWISHGMAMLVFQDSRKMATLRAVGISAGTVRRAYLGVALLLGAVGGSAGVLLGLASSALLNAFTPSLPALAGLPVRFTATPVEAAAMLLLAIATALAAAGLAAAYAGRQELLAALRG